jgi:hypothetical protein
VRCYRARSGRDLSCSVGVGRALARHVAAGRGLWRQVSARPAISESEWSKIDLVYYPNMLKRFSEWLGLKKKLHERQQTPGARTTVDGATIERRIRINRPNEGRGRCKGSRAPPNPPSKSGRNAPHPTTRKRPRETRRPFAPPGRSWLNERKPPRRAAAARRAAP